MVLTLLCEPSGAERDEQSQAITGLKTIWYLVAAGIASLAAMLKGWLFGSK